MPATPKTDRSIHPSPQTLLADPAACFRERPDGQLIQLLETLGATLHAAPFLRAAGSGNYRRGTQRLDRWRAGEVLPTPRQLERMQEAAPELSVELGAAVSSDRVAQDWNSRRPDVRWEGARHQVHLGILRDRLPDLLQHATAILANPRWAASKPLPATVGLAYIGGCRPSIGALLEAWQAGELQLPCPCGDVFYLWFASGSPLSGARSFGGGCPGCGLVEAPPARTGPTGSFIGRALQRWSRSPLPDVVAPVPFEWLLQVIRGEPAIVTGRDAQTGEEILRYDHGTGGLVLPAPGEATPNARQGTWAHSNLAARGRSWEVGIIPGCYGLPQAVYRHTIDGVGHVLMGHVAGTLCVRGVGPVLRLDGWVPPSALAIWAAEAGWIATAIADIVGSQETATG